MAAPVTPTAGPTVPRSALPARERAPTQRGMAPGPAARAPAAAAHPRMALRCSRRATTGTGRAPAPQARSDPARRARRGMAQRRAAPRARVRSVVSRRRPVSRRPCTRRASSRHGTSTRRAGPALRRSQARTAASLAGVWACPLGRAATSASLTRQAERQHQERRTAPGITTVRATTLATQSWPSAIPRRT